MLSINVGQDALYRRLRRQEQAHRPRVRDDRRRLSTDFDLLSSDGPLKTYAADMYALRAVKLYADGALGSRGGAALIAPYSDEPKSHGLLFRQNADIYALMEKAMKRGYQVNVHAIGDA
ncbi:hypothetical protein LP420_25085 [Massilia sp. B-10]|nr:hypothetical protein LP420_25085 [Massilia sp. B-10]